MNHQSLRRALLLAGALSAIAGRSFAQGISKPIKLVVPSAPGSSADLMSRMVGQRMSETLKQTVIVDNKPGANSIIATEYVAKATPDGSTLLVTGDYTLTVLPFLYKSVPFAAKDLVPLSAAVEVALNLAVRSDLSVRSTKEFISHAQKNPGVVTFATTGVGSAPHLAMELMRQRLGLQMLHVPFNGAPQAAAAVAAGQVDACFMAPSTIGPFAKGGRVRVLASTWESRNPIEPDLPTVGEELAGFSYVPTQCFFAPAGTPAPVIAALYGAIADAIRQPNIRRTLTEMGFVPLGNTPEQLKQALDRETDKWQKIIRAAGIEHSI